MPLITEAYDSLPCKSNMPPTHSLLYIRKAGPNPSSPDIDAPPTEDSLAAARALIDADIKAAGIDASQLHPALIPSASYIPTYSPALEQEHARLSADPTSKLSGVDLTRYEGLEPSASDSPAEWSATLQKAYSSSEYLNSRLTELGLLEKYGKNMWLVGNAQLEDVLKTLEAELAGMKAQIEASEETRRTNQGAVGGEVEILGETWRKGVGRVLETQVAAEALRREILERRRAGAV
jgi:pre-mRNA-splicing factor SPF27